MPQFKDQRAGNTRLQPPAGLLGCGIAFWGWHMDFLLPALLMGLLLELPWVIKTRWEISDTEFNRVTDLTTLLCLTLVLYLLARHSVQGLFLSLTWFPLPLFLPMLAQRFSTRNSIRLSSLFFSLRRQRPLGGLPDRARLRINIAYPYLILCLLSASVTKPPLFFPILILFFIWGLWPLRSPRYSLGVWAATLAVAMLLGFFAQYGITRLQTEIENWVLSWFEASLWAHDPYRRRTALGQIGELKLSNRILFRVQAPHPVLLAEASYDIYRRRAWHASQVQFASLPQDPSQGSWFLEAGEQKQGGKRLAVSLPVNREQALLPLPAGAYRLDALPGIEILRNRIDGALKAERLPGLLDYRVSFQPPGRNGKLTESSLQLPETEQEWVRRYAQQLGLHDPQLSKQEKIRRIERFFTENFRYSLVSDGFRVGTTALAHFMDRHRAGHCEYFATATVLLLRAADIQARYVAGFAVQEYSFLEEAYVVRRRHAHAWASAWLDGQWHDIDTTPAVWAEMESDSAAWWQPGYDFLAWLKYRFERWRWQFDETNEERTHWLWLLAPLLFILLWRLRHQRRRARRQNQEKRRLMPKPGEDSPFYQIIAHLEQTSPRYPGEALSAWLRRAAGAADYAPLHSLLELHYRHRFDPKGLAHSERRRLAQAVGDWLPPEANKR